MKNTILLIIISLFVFGPISDLKGQQSMAVSMNDSLVIHIDQSRGLLQWQSSHDSIVWTDIPGQNSATLQTIADTFDLFFRLKMMEGECEPWFSEVLKVTEFIPFVCGSSIAHGFVNGVSPDSSPLFAQRTYSTVQASWTGAGGNKCWTKMNLGATVEATSATDQGMDAVGWFFQFNRMQAYGFNGANRVPNTIWINPINENADWTAANDPCKLLLGSDWRVPTQAEWSAFLTASTAQGGVGSGYLGDAYISALKLHGGGNLSGGDGSLQNQGTYAYFWSSGQNSNNTAGSFRFGTNGSYPVNATKNFGYPLRCICD